MNWLAHLLLSEPTPEFRIGNMLPDMASPSELAAMPTAFQTGIQRHRQIDAFTDSHPVVRRSVARLGPDLRRFGGIVVDIFYDHVLAQRWESYSHTPLPVFAREVYASFETHWHVIPADAHERILHMCAEDWLCGYKEISGIEQTLHRIGSRFRRPVNLSPAVAILERDLIAFEADFDEFFPALISSVYPDFKHPTLQ